MVYFTFPINLLRHLKSLSAFRHKVHDNLTFCDHFVVTLRSKISISGIRRYKQIGFQKDRLPYPDYISAACCGWCHKHICGKLRLRQCQHSRLFRIFRKAILLDWTVGAAWCSHTLGRQLVFRHIRLPYIFCNTAATARDNLHCSQHQGVALMDCARPCEPAACGICQVCNGARSCQTVQRLQLLAQRQVQQLHKGGSNNNGADNADPVAERDGFGAGFHFARIRALPRGHERIDSVCRTLLDCDFRGGAEIFSDNGHGHPRRRIYRFGSDSADDSGNGGVLLQIGGYNTQPSDCVCRMRSCLRHSIRLWNRD